MRAFWLIVVVTFALITSGCRVVGTVNQEYAPLLIFTFPFVLIGAFGLLLYRSHRDDRTKKKDSLFTWQGLRRPLLFIATIFATVLIVNVIPEQDLNDPQKKLNYAIVMQDEDYELEAYKSALIKYPDSIDVHFHYLSLFLEHNKSTSVWSQKLFDYYEAISRHKSPERNRIGLLGMTSYYVKSKRFAEADVMLRPLCESGMKFSNFLMGKTLKGLGLHAEAMNYFWTEIAIDGFKGGAYKELANYYYLENDIDGLSTLIRSDKHMHYVPREILDYYFYNYTGLWSYTKYNVVFLARQTHWTGFFAAFLITIVWFLYLKGIRPQSRHHWPFLIATFIVGGLVPFLVLNFGGVQRYTLGVSVNGGFFQQLFFYVFSVGLVEELAKFLPFVFILLFTKRLKQPFDYLLYTCVAALGFAFTENLIYFQPSRLEIIHGRGFVSVVGHMTWSCFIAYAIVLCKFRYKIANYWPFVLLALIAASFAHGLFDFWLASSYQFSFFAYLIFLAGIQFWITMQNNALNNDSHISHKLLPRIKKTHFNLVYSLMGILLVQYLLMGIQEGPVIANYALYGSFLRGGYLIIYLSLTAGNFDLFPRYWQSIKIPYRLSDILIPQKVFTLTYVGAQVEVWTDGKKSPLTPYLPFKGTIIERKVVKNNNDWYLIRLNHPLPIGRYHKEYVLMKMEEVEMELEKGQFYYCTLRLLKLDQKVQSVKYKNDTTSPEVRAILTCHKEAIDVEI